MGKIFHFFGYVATYHSSCLLPSLPVSLARQVDQLVRSTSAEWPHQRGRHVVEGGVVDVVSAVTHQAVLLRHLQLLVGYLLLHHHVRRLVGDRAQGIYSLHKEILLGQHPVNMGKNV